MTNEEAAKILKLERDSWRENPKLKVDQRLYDAVDIAIKALEQKPCEDYISREELLKAIDTWDKFGCDADNKLIPVKDCYVPYIHYDDVVKCVKGLPSVNPKSKTGHWIPVSERLPEKDGEYLVTVSSFCGEIVFKCSFATDLHKIDEYEFPEHKCGFYGIDSEWGSYEIDNVIAWMPLPEAYKAESEE